MTEFKVWWIPQAPGKAFEVSVPDIETGILMCETLADYDLFQYDNKIKPDYCNLGGIQWRNAAHTDNEWEDIEYEDEEELAYIGGLINA